MRGLTAAAAVAGILTLSLPHGATGAAKGRLEGRVLNGATGRPEPGVRLTLTTGTDAGDGEVVGTIRSDAKGAYRFDDLATGEDRFYALDARFDGGLFAGRPISLPSDTTEAPVIESTLRVWNTTTEPGVMAISSDRMFVVQDGDGVGVIEAVEFVNTGTEAYIGRGAGMIGEEASGASFAFAMPPGASGFNPFESTLDIPEIVQVDQGYAATIAIPPGEHKTTFSYRVPGTGGSFDLSRPVLYPTLELDIYAADPLEVRSNRLLPEEGVELEGRTYARWSSDGTIEAGDPLQALVVASGSISLLPLLGGGAAVVLLVGIAALLLRRRNRPDAQTALPDREQLLEEVAVLDLAFEAGEIDRESWDDRRTALIGRIRRSEGAGR